MPTRRLPLAGSDLVVPAGAALTVLAAYLSVRLGAQLGVGAVLVVALYLAIVVGYVTVPHLVIAGTIALFAVVPALKVFTNPAVGAVKDLATVAAVSAAVLLYVFERRRPDRWAGLLVLLLLALYVLNVGRSHNTAWAQGVRLTAEPLLLLLVGLIAPNPRRNLRYAIASLIVVGCGVAFYGLVQQALGVFRLESLGYTFGQQLRTISGTLRSFGTLDEPFAYAAFLMFAVAGVIFWLRRGALAWAAGTLLLLGLAASYVRTTLLVGIAFGALLLIRWQYTTAALFLVAAMAIVASVTLVNATGTQTQSFKVYASHGNVQLISRATLGSSDLVLNGRIGAWQAALGRNPAAWLFGRGVGKVGTAAQRASSAFIPTSGTANGQSKTQTTAVDSGYIATVADVGLVGLAVMLALFGRLIALGIRYARKNIIAGWVALALIACMMLDALTRASFTGFPTAFIGLLLVGIALAAGAEEFQAVPSSSHSQAG